MSARVGGHVLEREPVSRFRWVDPMERSGTFYHESHYRRYLGVFGPAQIQRPRFDDGPSDTRGTFPLFFRYSNVPYGSSTRHKTTTVGLESLETQYIKTDSSCFSTVTLKDISIHRTGYTLPSGSYFVRLNPQLF